MKIRDKITGAFFAAVIGILFVLAMAEITQRGYQKHLDKQVSADMLAAYPFPEEERKPEDTSFFLVQTTAKISDMVRTIEEKIKNHAVAFEEQLVLAARFLDRSLGLDMTTSQSGGQNNTSDEGDVVTVYSGDTLGFVADDADISDRLENLIDFGQQMTEENRDFLLFLTPSKFMGNEVFTDHSQERHDLVMTSMQDADLHVYDAGEMLGETPPERAPYFFKTDHHWLPTTGLLACQRLGEYLNENCGYEIDTSLFDLENYEITTLAESYLGSQGKKVTEAYTSADDFPIVMPKYASDLDVFISDKNATLHGSAGDTLFDPSILKENNKYSRYDYYGYGNQSLIRIHNNGLQNGKRILWIKESMANCMYPYFANAVEDLDVIDLRGFTGSLQTFIEETDPDTVVMVYGLSSFNPGWAEGLAAFDFR